MIEEWIRGEPPDLWPSYLTAYSLDEKRSYFYDAAGRLTSVNRGSHSAPQAAYALRATKRFKQRVAARVIKSPSPRKKPQNK